MKKFWWVLGVLGCFTLAISIAQAQTSVSVDLEVNKSDGPLSLKKSRFGKNSVTLTWDSEGVTACSGDWTKSKLKLSGRQNGKLSTSRSFTITCTGENGETAQDSVTVTVGQTATPASAIVNPPPQGNGTRTMTQSASYTTPAENATCQILLSATVPFKIPNGSINLSDVPSITPITVSGNASANGNCVGPITISSTLSGQTVPTNEDGRFVLGPAPVRGALTGSSSGDKTVYNRVEVYASDVCGWSNAVAVETCSETNTDGLYNPGGDVCPYSRFPHREFAPSRTSPASATKAPYAVGAAAESIVKESIIVSPDPDYSALMQRTRDFTPAMPVSPLDDFRVTFTTRGCSTVSLSKFSASLVTNHVGRDIVVAVSEPVLLRSAGNERTYSALFKGYPRGITDEAKAEALVTSIASGLPIFVRITETGGIVPRETQGGIRYEEESIVVDTPLRMSNCAQVYGSGKHKIVGMREDKEYFGLLRHYSRFEEDRTGGFNKVEPFATYRRSFSFFLDLSRRSTKGAIEQMLTAEQMLISADRITMSRHNNLLEQALGSSSCSEGTNLLYTQLPEGLGGIATAKGKGALVSVDAADPLVTVHEFAHAFAGVEDEYLYGYNYTASQAAAIGFGSANCAFNAERFAYRTTYGNPVKPCNVKDAYRPTAASIMNRGPWDNGKFNVVSCGYILAAILGGDPQSHYATCNGIEGVYKEKPLSVTSPLRRFSSLFSTQKQLAAIGASDSGALTVIVENHKTGKGNAIVLTDSPLVIEPAVSRNQPPIISSFTGPATLTTGQTGTWSASAGDPDGTKLGYRIVWGYPKTLDDVGAYKYASAVGQSTDFSAGTSYPYAGNYTVTLTVTDDTGASVLRQSTVRVASTTVTVLQPTVDLKVNGQNSVTVSPNSSLSLSWTSTNSVSCTSPDISISGTSGSVQASAGSTNKTFTITCSGYGGQASDSATVSIYGGSASSGALTPTASLSINSSSNDFTLQAGQEITPEWSSTNASYCTNNWNSSRATYNRGSDTLSAPSATKTYTLTCYSSTGQSTSDSVTVTLQSVAPPPPPAPATVTSDSVSFSLTSTTEDKTGGYSFVAGNGPDWGYTATFSLTAPKTIKAIEIYAGTEKWSTSASNYYNLVVFDGTTQQNSTYGQTFPLPAGTKTLTLYAQKWFQNFNSSYTLTVTFTDGTTLSATVGASARVNKLHAFIRSLQTASTLQGARLLPW